MRGKIFNGCVTAAINLEGDGPMESVTKVCSKPVLGLGFVPIRGGGGRYQEGGVYGVPLGDIERCLRSAGVVYNASENLPDGHRRMNGWGTS